jgi:hypothetical protein
MKAALGFAHPELLAAEIAGLGQPRKQTGEPHSDRGENPAMFQER